MLNITTAHANMSSLFIIEQTIMGRSPRCYTPCFLEIDPSVPVKRLFEGFVPYMGMAAILFM